MKKNKMDGWINKVRCPKKLEEQTNEAVEKSGQTYSEYIRKIIGQGNKKILKG